MDSCGTYGTVFKARIVCWEQHCMHSCRERWNSPQGVNSVLGTALHVFLQKESGAATKARTELLGSWTDSCREMKQHLRRKFSSSFKKKWILWNTICFLYKVLFSDLKTKKILKVNSNLLKLGVEVVESSLHHGNRHGLGDGGRRRDDRPPVGAIAVDRLDLCRRKEQLETIEYSRTLGRYI